MQETVDCWDILITHVQHIMHIAAPTVICKPLPHCIQIYEMLDMLLTLGKKSMLHEAEPFLLLLTV